MPGIQFHVKGRERQRTIDAAAAKLLTDAVLAIRRQLEAGVADALKAALRVDAAAVTTHHSVHNALIDI